MNGMNSPDIERVVRQPTFSLDGEGRIYVSKLARTRGCLRGSYPQHADQDCCVNKGDPVRSADYAVDANKFEKQGCIDDESGVGLADSTRRLGEPITWGSGQQRMNRLKET